MTNDRLNNRIAIYIIFILSVYFQIVLNLYDKYVNYKDLNNYHTYIESLDAIKDRSGGETHFKNDSTEVPNYFIPKQAQYVRSYVRQSYLPSIRLSSSIIGIYNRYAIMEGVYPIQVSESSPYVITAIDDQLPERCHVLDSKEGVQIVYCP